MSKKIIEEELQFALLPTVMDDGKFIWFAWYYLTTYMDKSGKVCTMRVLAEELK